VRRHRHVQRTTDQWGRELPGGFAGAAAQAATVKGWYSGPSVDSEDTLQLSRHSGVVSLNEIFPLEQVQAADKRMIER
jgi:hypothetical protein